MTARPGCPVFPARPIAAVGGGVTVDRDFPEVANTLSMEEVHRQLESYCGQGSPEEGLGNGVRRLTGLIERYNQE